MPNKRAGFIYGPLEHHLDHVGIFCSLIRIPLIVTDETLRDKARIYYPDLEVIYWNCLEAPFKATEAFDTLFYSTPRVMFDEVFFIAEATIKKRVRTIWLPHGNSDKGHASYFMEGLKHEEKLLVYGPKMIDFLKQKQVDLPTIEIGNYRLEYYRRHREYYSTLLGSIKIPGKKTLLYAPTWQDIENSTSFFEAAEQLISLLPEDIYLVIKLHPNLETHIRTEQLILQNESHPSVRFLRGITPVYPFLDQADLYLGDMSSVGYDFLAFNRPMFFLNPNRRTLDDPGLFLHRCGRTIDPEEYSKIFTLIQEDGPQSHLHQIRLETYAYTFGPEKTFEVGVKPLDIDTLDSHSYRRTPLS